jgi:hypothetical protein
MLTQNCHTTAAAMRAGLRVSYDWVDGIEFT